MRSRRTNDDNEQYSIGFRELLKNNPAGLIVSHQLTHAVEKSNETQRLVAQQGTRGGARGAVTTPKNESKKH